MKPLGCAPYPQTRRHPRTAGGADAPHLCTSKRYDPKADELLLGTDAVDVVVKATVARAGQIAAATEKQHRRARAVNGRDERGLVIVTTAPLLALLDLLPPAIRDCCYHRAARHSNVSH